MNERIRELLAQAGFDPAAIERMGVMPNAEKFAELIVLDCARALQTEMYRLDAIPGREVSAQTMETAAELIKKRFGVQ